jgi:putative SOS response-associated peptidase YedK
MPVILSRSDEDAWLDPEVRERAILQKLLRPCPSLWLSAFEVSELVNSAKNNTPEVLRPAVVANKDVIAPRLF